VANVLLAYKGKNHLGGAARAAEDIARQTARELLGPLLDAAVSRLGFVLRKALDIAADKAMWQGEHGGRALGMHSCSRVGICECANGQVQATAAVMQLPDSSRPFISFYSTMHIAQGYLNRAHHAHCKRCIKGILFSAVQHAIHGAVTVDCVSC
jgi:hypothetical protein